MPVRVLTGIIRIGAGYYEYNQLNIHLFLVMVILGSTHGKPV